MNKIIECRQKTTLIISTLRTLVSFADIPNEVIAKLNDVAYKAINSGSLTKLVNKRAVKNEDLYEKMDHEMKDIIGKLNFEELTASNVGIISDIGNCSLSLVNSVEAIQDSDCMCIGLNIKRPEAAIADASRLIIKDIYPTYMTANSFLESA